MNVNGTAHIKDHVRKLHSIDPSTDSHITKASTPESPFTAAAHVPGSSTQVSHTPWEEESLQTAVVDWTIMRDLSFHDVTSPSTQGLLTWNRANLLHALPNSHSTLSTYIKKLLHIRKAEVIEIIQSASSKVSVSVDVWTSDNHLSFLGVVAHFVDAENNQRDLLIGFRNLAGDHTASAQASVILNVIREYGFESSFNCFVGDNASNNDKKLITYLNEGSLMLKLGTEHRIRCAGHIINLIVKATLYGTGVSEFEQKLAKAAPMDQFRLYRQHGVVGKLHNFVRAVCASHKRRELFLSTFNDLGDEDPTWKFVKLQLLQDGGVRWHSVYVMLLRCQELRDPIKAFQRKYKLKMRCTDKEFFDDDDGSVGRHYNPVDDAINDDDWAEVADLVNFLKVPYDLCKALEGSNNVSGFGSLWQTLINLQALWQHYNTAAERYDDEDDSYFASAVRFGLEKLNTYWTKLVIDPSPSYYTIATALHPRLRLNWFKCHWRDYPHWHQKADKSLRDTFKKYLAAENEPDELQTEDQLRRRKIPASYVNNPLAAIMEVDQAYLNGHVAHKRQKRQNELDDYIGSLNEDLNKDEAYQELMADPWRWWLKVGRSRYPTLFKMAADFLSIPSTSCECERCFSSAKRTITCDRNSLSPSTIEACQLQKNWLKNDVVDSPLVKLSQHVQWRRSSDESSAASIHSDYVD